MPAGECSHYLAPVQDRIFRLIYLGALAAQLMTQAQFQEIIDSDVDLQRRFVSDPATVLREHEVTSESGAMSEAAFVHLVLTSILERQR